MADLFIVKLRLKFTLMLMSVGIVLGALATWYFYDQIEFESDRSPFLLSAAITGAMVLGWFGLLLVFFAAKRIMNPSHNFINRLDQLPWWLIRVVLVLCLIGAGVFFIGRYRLSAENEFDLLRAGHFQLLEERIKEKPHLIEHKNGKGKTLLQVAYRENLPEAVAVLLDNGSEIIDLDPQGRDPIIASLGNLPMLGTLLDCGLNPNLPDTDGVTAVFHAVALESKAVLVRLIEGGANVNGRDRLSRTPLMSAVENNRLAMVDALIELGAAVNAFDQRGDTALHIAVRRKNTEIIRLLLEHDADARTFNFIHLTPLHIAALAGDTELISIFMELSDMTELADETDRTPLDMALQSRKYDAATLLIENGADIDRAFLDGATRLHRAILEKKYAIARFLIRAGANAELADKSGRTVIGICRDKELQGLVELIETVDGDTL